MLCINRQGGTVSPSLCKVAVELWEDCITMMVHRRAVHVPRIQNVEADRLIRVEVLPHKWELNQRYLQPLFQLWGTHRCFCELP